MSRILRLCLFCLSWLAFPASAVDRIEIYADQVSHPAAQLENFSGTLDMDGRWHGKAMLKQGDAAQLAREYPLPVTVSKGTLRGKAEFSGEQRELRRLKGDLFLKDAAFSDEAGLHAGEKVDLHLDATVVRDGGRWRWSGKLDGSNGEVFWQPLYLARLDSGFAGQGWLSDNVITVEQGRFSMGGVGAASVTGSIRRPDN
ncbi:MAG TPA: hypothetical protein VK938_04045, partial [Methylophilaceae bacterium]|nr:hypothetical protein [Methylophilaceae bacterium]